MTRSISLIVDGTALDFSLVYTRRKTIGLRVFPDGRVEVRAPNRTALKHIEAVVRERAAWIRQHQRRFSERPAAASKLERRYVTGEVFGFLGDPLTLHVIEAPRRRVTRDGTALHVYTPTPNDPASLRKQIDAWYRRQAMLIFREQLAICHAFAMPILNKPLPELRLRRMKSRWGSCSSKGVVTLNVRLVEAPIALIDYVILHELCHLRQMNHSPKYYALLGEVEPRWKSLRAALHTYPFRDWL